MPTLEVLFMTIQAIFLDRDGTLGGSDQVIYPGEFSMFPGTEDSIRRLREAGVLVCSFTNQPGISRGEATVDEFVHEMTGFGFDRVYVCPHAHGEGCTCRKPSPGMLLRAAEENGLDLRQCVVIGDRWTDLLAADEAGCRKVLVMTGSGHDTYEKYRNGEYFRRWQEVEPDFVAEDLNEAVEWLLQP